jgi:hypothetical protein
MNYSIDLSDLDIQEIQVLAQQGGRGMPEFAASTGKICEAGSTCSCTVNQFEEA